MTGDVALVLRCFSFICLAHTAKLREGTVMLNEEEIFLQHVVPLCVHVRRLQVVLRRFSWMVSLGF